MARHRTSSFIDTTEHVLAAGRLAAFTLEMFTQIEILFHRVELFLFLLGGESPVMGPMIGEFTEPGPLPL